MPPATEQIDQVYDMLATQSATLLKIFERIEDYYSMSWLLISSNNFVTNRIIDIVKKGIENLASEYIKIKRIDTNLFISLAVCIYVLKAHNKKLTNKIRKTISFVLSQLESNRRLRTPEIVGNIVFFLSRSNEFKEELDILKRYMKDELDEAIKARNCVAIIDSCFGLLPLYATFDFHLFEECLKNMRLLDIDRIAKALIILSISNNSLKENYFVYLRNRLQEEYISKLSGILQAIVNGISLVGSELSNEEAKQIFAELKENEWTKVIRIEKKEIILKNFSPSFLRILNSKSIGLCLLSMEIANKKTRISLYPDEFEKFNNAWKEKKFGFGVNRKQLRYLHYSSLAFILCILSCALWIGGFNQIIINDISCILLKGFEVSCLLSTSIHSSIILVILGTIITYYRIFRKFNQEGEIKLDEILLMIPIFGRIVRYLRGEGK